jgi:hypothetical protein
MAEDEGKNPDGPPPGSPPTGNLQIGPEERRRIMLEEYAALEKRCQNDSVVGYALVGAIIVTWLVVISTNAVRFVTDKSETATATLLVFLSISIVSLWISATILERFKDAGDIRIARCHQIEKELDMRSFTLFTDRFKGDDEYYSILGQIATIKEGQGYRDMGVIDRGKLAMYLFKNKKLRVMALLKMSMYAIVFAWVALVLVQLFLH